jgi:selenium-binding protein 1
MKPNLLRSLKKPAVMAIAALSVLSIGVLPVKADETCQSPYMAKIIGQEDFVYVWTLGIEGLGDGQDKLVTVDVNPNSPKFGTVVSKLSVGGRNEAHHSGFTDDRKYLWAGGLDTNKIFIFDVHTNPGKPTLYKEIDTFVADSGYRPFQ